MKNTIKITLLFVVASTVPGCATQETVRWSVHDMNRPKPPVVTPGHTNADAPSDAIVLFDGSDLSAWQAVNGGQAKWKVENGYIQVVPKSGWIQTGRPFGSCQLHIEWASPEIVKGKVQVQYRVVHVTG